MIEVSDTSLLYERNTKLPLHARFGIPEVWLMDLSNETIERHNEPAEDGYRRLKRVRRGMSLRSEMLPGLVFPADAVLG